MDLKTSLSALTMEAAVLGGAVLGSGGGGKLEDGLYLGELAAAQGGAHLSEPARLGDSATAAAVMPYHTSGSDTYQIHPRQAHTAMQVLQANQEPTIEGLANGGLGAVDSIIGWELSGFLSIPLLDGGVPPIYQPASLPNLLNFWQETAAEKTFTVSLAGRFHNGQGHRQHLWHGRPVELLQQLSDLPSIEEESFVAAAGPLLPAHLHPSTVSRTLRVGQAILAVNDDGGEATVAALQSQLPIHFSAFATVTEINWLGPDHDPTGHIKMRDNQNRRLQLTYNQRYTELAVDGRITAVFPDLIITLGTLGTPLTGEEVFMGQDLHLIVVPQAVAAQRHQ